MAKTNKKTVATLPPIQIRNQNVVDLGLEDVERTRLEQKRTRLMSKTIVELKEILRARKQKVGGKKAVLVNRILGLEEKKLDSIQNSRAARLLRRDIYEGNDLHDSNNDHEPLEPEAVYHTRAVYREYPLEAFSALLDELRAAHLEQKKLAANDDELVLEQLEFIGGMATTDNRGFTSWPNHPGRKLLQEDIANEQQKKMKPDELRLSRPEYWDLSKKEFRKRIDQEVLRIKQNNMNVLKWDEDDDSVEEVEEWSDDDSANE